MRLLDSMLRRLVTRGELIVTDADGTRHHYGTPDSDLTPVAVRFADRRVPGEILRNVRLAFAEAYMEGRLTFDDGDVVALIRMVGANRRWEERSPKPSSAAARWLSRLRPRNREGRARRNVAHHYDIGNALYRLFLDDDLQYSCAYFTEAGESLEQAQLNKKAHVAAKLFLRPGQRVLDIGCGWGGTALYLHRHCGVEVLGITLSDQQLELARRRAEEAGVADRVRFELLDYRQVGSEFDRIVSIGMFEHVGAAQYDAFFRQCRNLLKPDGVMLLHSIGQFDRPQPTDPFANKYIFPGYHLPNLSQIVAASERYRLIAADVENWRLHYAWTLRHWLERTRAHRAEIVALYDERFFRMWEVYLAGAMAMFETGAGCVYQIQYVRRRDSIPIVRDPMLVEERRLKAAETAAAAGPPEGVRLVSPSYT